MFTYLFNKLPAVRRLRAAITSAEAKTTTTDRALAQNREEHKHTLDMLARAQDEIVHTKHQRNQLRSELDGLREVVVKQSASIEILTKDRERGELRIAELKLAVGEDKQREERFVRTIDALNENLRERLAEIADLNTALSSAEAELARGRRPVLFHRAEGMTERRRAELLIGRGDTEQVKAIMDLLDECAVASMSESTSRPIAAFGNTVPFTERDREYCAGGVFALTEFKRRLVELIEPMQEAKKAA